MNISDEARHGILQWVIVALVSGAVLGIIALRGGFEPRKGPPGWVEPGESQTTTRWEFRVDRAEITTKQYSDVQVLRVWFVLTNLWNETLSSPTTEIVVVEMDGKQVEETFFCSPDDPVLSLDPGIPQVAYLEAPLEELPQAGDTVVVRLADESEKKGIVTKGWGFDHEIKGVRLTVEQSR